MKKMLLMFLLPAAVIAGVYYALITYDNAFRYGRMRETPVIRPHEKQLPVMEAGIVPFSGGEMNYRVQSSVDLTSPLNMNAVETIQRGKGVYSTYCAQCHGKSHDGNGTVGQSFSPLPTDLRAKKVQSEHEGRLFKHISYGAPNSRQPALYATVDILDRWRVIAYVKSLGLRR
ncbi:MAG: c-type cytochrome [Desulfobacterales bacterium]